VANVPNLRGSTADVTAYLAGRPFSGPDLEGFGHHPRLARPGRRVDHRDALAVGQRRQHSRGLIGSQPRTFGMMTLNLARVRPACPGAAPARSRVLARRRHALGAARPLRLLARGGVLPWLAARGWRTARRHGAGRCCARRRAASCAEPAPLPALLGRSPARTPNAARDRPSPQAGYGRGRCHARPWQRGPDTSSGRRGSRCSFLLGCR
jgi:hypothetical protein